MKIIYTAPVLIIILVAIALSFFKQEPKKEEPKGKRYEKYYQTKMCNKLDGIIEYRLPDRTRVDCLTDDYAIEVDWAKKWAEGIGQALYYAQMTGRDPAVGLIIGKGDERYLKRLKKVADEFDIKIIILEK